MRHAVLRQAPRVLADRAVDRHIGIAIDQRDELAGEGIDERREVVAAAQAAQQLVEPAVHLRPVVEQRELPLRFLALGRLLQCALPGLDLLDVGIGAAIEQRLELGLAGHDLAAGQQQLALFVAHAERQGHTDLDVVRDQFEQLHGVPSIFGRSLCRRRRSVREH